MTNLTGARARSKWPPEAIAEAAKQLQKGHTHCVAQGFGVSPKVLRKALRYHGVLLREIRPKGVGSLCKTESIFGRSGQIDARPAAEKLIIRGEDQCAWPIGKTDDAGFKWCGRKRQKGRPYCAHHMAVAYTPADASEA